MANILKIIGFANAGAKYKKMPKTSEADKNICPWMLQY
jgi:hypothetical protein